jgi:type IV pilus assembly protein PilE
MTSNQAKHLAVRARGFTLIELMIAVAIAAILAMVAMPSYQNYLRRGQLSDAFTTLADMRVKMEQYYQDNKFYGTGSASTTCATLPAYSGFPVTTKYFRLECDNNGGAAPLQVYQLKAVGTGSLTTGYDYTVNQAGTKGTTLFANATSTAACWLTKATTCDN